MGGIPTKYTGEVLRQTKVRFKRMFEPNLNAVTGWQGRGRARSVCCG
jgi:hypothetical protein